MQQALLPPPPSFSLPLSDRDGYFLPDQQPSSSDNHSPLQSLNSSEGDSARLDVLRHYFEGLHLKVEKVVIMREQTTNKSRGFGFVTLASADDLNKVIANSNLELDGRKIEAKRAIPKKELANQEKKIFVGGIPVSLSKQEFRSYFEQFGPVLETQVVLDRNSGRSRGFGFVTFRDKEVAEEVLKMDLKILNKPVQVKRADPRPESSSSSTSSPPSSLKPTIASPSSAGAPSASLDLHQHHLMHPINGMNHSHPSPVPMYVPGSYPYPYGTAIGYDPGYYMTPHSPPPAPPHHHHHLSSYYEYDDAYNPSLLSFNSRENYNGSYSLQPAVESRKNSAVKPTVTIKFNSLQRAGSPPYSINLDHQPSDYLSVVRKTDSYSSSNLSKVAQIHFSETARTDRSFTTGFLPEGLTASVSSTLYPTLSSVASARLKNPLNMLPHPSLSSLMSPGSDPRTKRAGTTPTNSRKKDDSLMTYAVTPSYSSSPFGNGAFGTYGGGGRVGIKRENWRTPFEQSTR